jgi:hypothetical protein
MNATETKLTAEIHVWSAIGDTPLTKRGGSYCDHLAYAEIEVGSPSEARKKAIGLIRSTPGGNHAHYNVPAFWNQNMRSGYVRTTDTHAEGESCSCGRTARRVDGRDCHGVVGIAYHVCGCGLSWSNGEKF